MIFPAPHARETIASYGYRIARLSGMSSLPELTRLFDLDLRALLGGDRYSIERLAGYAGCDPAALAEGALDASNAHRLQIGSSRRSTVLCCRHSFRFCPGCLTGLSDGDLRAACLGRTEWLVDANHVCTEHALRLVSISPRKPARVHGDLSIMVPELTAAQAVHWQPEAPTTLERYIVARLNGVRPRRWIDRVPLDVAIHTAEVFGAMAMRGPHASWRDMSGAERREHGRIGIEVLIVGSAAIKDFLRTHIGRGRRGNDYRKAFGRAFNEFYYRKDQPDYRPICGVLAEYVGETFHFSGQETVFGIRTRGLEPRTLRSLCNRHGVGFKITAEVLKSQYGVRAKAYDEVDPALIAELAPKLKNLLNAQESAHHLGVSVDLMKGLIADEVLIPDYRFNDRMVGFRQETLDGFLDQWRDPKDPETTADAVATTPLTRIAGANRTRTSQLLLAAKATKVTLLRDGSRRGLAALSVADHDIPALLECAKSGCRR